MALLILVLAVFLSISWRGGSSGGDWRADESVDTDALAFLAELERQPIDSLPEDVFTYETLALQPVPGTPQHAEVIYLPYDMEVTIATPVRLYARVEAFPSQEDATARAAEVLRGYPSDQRTDLLGGVTPVRIGFTETNDAWFASWTKGQFCVYVRAFYDRPVPVDGRAQRVLENQGFYIASAVELFQRTGEQGVGARTILEDAGLMPDLPEDQRPSIEEIPTP